MKYVQVLISPEEEAALSDCVSAFKDLIVEDDAFSTKEAELAYKWLTYVREVLHETWQSLPPGSHMKDAYRDDVWAWNDNDLI